MCGSMADFQSATAEIDQNLYNRRRSLLYSERVAKNRNMTSSICADAAAVVGQSAPAVVSHAAAVTCPARPQ